MSWLHQACVMIQCEVNNNLYLSLQGNAIAVNIKLNNAVEL